MEQNELKITTNNYNNSYNMCTIDKITNVMKII